MCSSDLLHDNNTEAFTPTSAASNIARASAVSINSYCNDRNNSLINCHANVYDKCDDTYITEVIARHTALINTVVTVNNIADTVASINDIIAISFANAIDFLVDIAFNTDDHLLIESVSAKAINECFSCVNKNISITMTIPVNVNKTILNSISNDAIVICTDACNTIGITSNILVNVNNKASQYLIDYKRACAFLDQATYEIETHAKFAKVQADISKAHADRARIQSDAFIDFYKILTAYFRFVTNANINDIILNETLANFLCKTKTIVDSARLHADALANASIAASCNLAEANIRNVNAIVSNMFILTNIYARTEVI